MKKNLLIGLVVFVSAYIVVAVVIGAQRSGGQVSPGPGASASAFPPASTATSTVAPSPSSSSQPARSSAPSPASSPPNTAAAAAGAPVFRSGSATSTVQCAVPGEGPAGSTADSPTVTLTWSSAGASTAFVGVDTTDAHADPYSEAAVSGTISLPFACPEGSHTFTVTLVGPGGDTSRTFTVQNTGHRG